MKRLRRDADVAAANDAPVLIFGVSGSGRETVARRIHVSGSQAHRPFIDVPCAALEPQAVADLLFRNDEAPSRIRLAHGGTLYLEDVDRLSLDLQQQLSATLVSLANEEGAPRIIASAVPGGKQLDAGLLACVDVIRLHVPALRDRREDIAELAEGYMSDLATEYGRDPRRFDPASIERLKTWDWPGDLRELRNVVERVLLLSESETVCPEDLPARLGSSRSTVVDLYGTFATLDAGLAAFTRHLVDRTMLEEDGHRDSAANRLGIERKTLDEILDAG